MIDTWPDEKWVPDSCCIPSQLKENCGKIWDIQVHSQGCYSQIHNFFVRRLDIIGSFGITIAFIQVIYFLEWCE